MIIILLLVVIFVVIMIHKNKTQENFDYAPRNQFDYVPRNQQEANSKFMINRPANDYWSGNQHPMKYNVGNWIDIASINKGTSCDCGKIDCENCKDLWRNKNLLNGEVMNNAFMESKYTGPFKHDYHSFGYGIIRHKSRNINDHLQRSKETDISTPKFTYRHNYDDDYLLLYNNPGKYSTN